MKKQRVIQCAIFSQHLFGNKHFSSNLSLRSLIIVQPAVGLDQIVGGLVKKWAQRRQYFEIFH